MRNQRDKMLTSFLKRESKERLLIQCIIFHGRVEYDIIVKLDAIICLDQQYLSMRGVIDRCESELT